MPAKQERDADAGEGIGGGGNLEREIKMLGGKLSGQWVVLPRLCCCSSTTFSQGFFLCDFLSKALHLENNSSSCIISHLENSKIKGIA